MARAMLAARINGLGRLHSRGLCALCARCRKHLGKHSSHAAKTRVRDALRVACACAEASRAWRARALTCELHHVGRTWDGFGTSLAGGRGPGEFGSALVGHGTPRGRAARARDSEGSLPRLCDFRARRAMRVCISRICVCVKAMRPRRVSSELVRNSAGRAFTHRHCRAPHVFSWGTSR